MDYPLWHVLPREFVEFSSRLDRISRLDGERNVPFAYDAGWHATYMGRLTEAHRTGLNTVVSIVTQDWHDACRPAHARLVALSGRARACQAMVVRCTVHYQADALCGLGRLQLCRRLD